MTRRCVESRHSALLCFFHPVVFRMHRGASLRFCVSNARHRGLYAARRVPTGRRGRGGVVGTRRAAYKGGLRAERRRRGVFVAHCRSGSAAEAVCYGERHTRQPRRGRLIVGPLRGPEPGGGSLTHSRRSLRSLGNVLQTHRASGAKPGVGCGVAGVGTR